MPTFYIYMISLDITESSINFSYMKNYNRSWGKACLQLPHTSNSRHFIDGIANDEWEDEQQAIFHQLHDFYFSAFKNSECAAASAKVGLCINHVEPVIDKNGREFYIAFSNNDAWVLVASTDRDPFNNVCVFEDPSHSRIEFDKDELSNQAKKSWFLSLSEMLKKEMQKDLIIFNGNTGLSDEQIIQYFGETLEDFMRAEFEKHEGDYETDDIAQDFYTDIGCNIRGYFEDQAKDLLEENNDKQ